MPDGRPDGERAGGRGTRWACCWPGPLALCLFLLAIRTACMAVMARAAPQLNIYSVGFTLQVLVVLFGGLFLLPEMIPAP